MLKKKTQKKTKPTERIERIAIETTKSASLFEPATRRELHILPVETRAGRYNAVTCALQDILFNVRNETYPVLNKCASRRKSDWGCTM